MKLNLKLTWLSFSVASVLTCATLPAFAQQSADTQNTTPEHHVLPFWGDELAAKGYDLPEPFGVGVNYTNIRQNVQVNQIGFSSLSVNPQALAPAIAPAILQSLPSALQQSLAPQLSGIIGQLPTSMPLPGNLFNVQAGKTRMRSYSTTVRLDAWVFPFLNVYALAGKTHGDSTSQVSIGIDKAALSGLVSQAAPALLGQLPPPAQQAALGAVGTAVQTLPAKQDFSYTLNFKGATYGAGLTVGGAYHHVFGLLDANFTQTRFDVLDGHINAFTLTPRVGYSFTLPAIVQGASQGKLNLWVGGMYLYTQQTYSGKLSHLNLPFAIQQYLGNDGRFEVKQHVSNPWNVLVGAQYAITRNFNISTEIGFARRNSVIVSGEFRF